MSIWADARGAGFFLRPDAEVFPALAAVSAWASGQRYEPAAVSTFLQVADYYLVAHSLAGQHTVVTHEVPSASTRKIKIPERMHRSWYQVHDAVRDAAARAGAVCPRAAAMSTDRTSEYVSGLISELRKLPTETGWLEFKENNTDPEDIGEYLSALSNTAAIEGKANAYVVLIPALPPGCARRDGPRAPPTRRQGR